MKIISGETWYTYSSKLSVKTDLKVAAEKLVNSDAFVFSIRDNGEFCYKKNSTVSFGKLNCKLNSTGTGMTTTGHTDFIQCEPDNYTLFSFWKSIELKLSRIRLFNDSFGFPEDFIRVFMRPIFLKTSHSSEIGRAHV